MSLLINVDDDYGCLQVDFDGNKFRSIAEDFLIMCYTSLSKNEEYSTMLLKSIFELASSSN